MIKNRIEHYQLINRRLRWRNNFDVSEKNGVKLAIQKAGRLAGQSDGIHQAKAIRCQNMFILHTIRRAAFGIYFPRVFSFKSKKNVLL